MAGNEIDKDLYGRLRSIAIELKDRYQAERVVLYGSHSRGQAGPDSDVDLLVVAATEEKFYDRMATVLGLVRTTRRGLPISPLVLTPTEVRERLERGDIFIRDILENGVDLNP